MSQPGRVRKSAAEQIYEDLKGRIVRYELRPGQRLVEATVAHQWRVSRTPAREALRRLVQEGFLRRESRGGYHVRDMDLEVLEELYEVRVALETFATRLAIERGRGPDWEDVARTWMAIVEPFPPAEVLLERDEAFHMEIAAASGNRTLVEYLRGINDRIRAVRLYDFSNPDRVRATCTQHAAIAGLIARREADKAADAMRAHILESKANVLHAAKELLAAIYLKAPQRR
jgi:DNA-binding GntR family transcriptional regulator